MFALFDIQHLLCTILFSRLYSVRFFHLIILRQIFSDFLQRSWGSIVVPCNRIMNLRRLEIKIDKLCEVNVALKLYILKKQFFLLERM